MALSRLRKKRILTCLHMFVTCLLLAYIIPNLPGERELRTKIVQKLVPQNHINQDEIEIFDDELPIIPAKKLRYPTPLRSHIHQGEVDIFYDDELPIIPAKKLRSPTPLRNHIKQDEADISDAGELRILPVQKLRSPTPSQNNINGVEIFYSDADSLERKVEEFNKFILDKTEIYSHKTARKSKGEQSEVTDLSIAWTKSILSVFWCFGFETVRGFSQEVTEKHSENAYKQYTQVVQPPNLYNYFTGNGKGIDTFILSWKRNSFTNLNASSWTYLRSILPVKKYYGCYSSPHIKSMGGLRKMSGSITFSACTIQCSANVVDLNKITVPPAHMMLTDYTETGYRVGCENINHGQMNWTKVVQDVINKNLLLDIITALDVIKDGGLIAEHGYVFTNNHQVLFPFDCVYRPYWDSWTTKCMGPNKFWKEVFIITQRPKNCNYFHVFVEQLSRLSTFVPFLQQRPHIAIHVHAKADFNSIMFWMDVYGLVNPIVSGFVSANTIYMPHGGGCHNLHLPFAQMMSLRYRQYIWESLLNLETPNSRPTVILIKRSTRSIANHQDVLSVLQILAESKNYELIVFDDSELPSIENTMLYFYGAKLVVGSHGAGLSNIIFSQPGTTVIEVHCKGVENVRLAFFHLAVKLGMRYYATVTTRPHPLSDRCHEEGVFVNMEEFKQVLNFIWTYL